MNRTLHWISISDDMHEGYSRLGIYMIRALVKAGVRVMPFTRGFLKNVGWDVYEAATGETLSLSLGTGDMFVRLRGKQWGYTMHESTVLPDGWADSINRTCERLLVPAEWLIPVFREGGVKESIPLHVMPCGVDIEEFPIVRRGERDIYTFLALADRGWRKGWSNVWRAFYDAFGDYQQTPDVRLILKCRTGGMKELSGNKSDPRLMIIRQDLKSLNDLYAISDCYVAPHYGEGWGLTPREAAATGMPVITMDWGGTGVDIDHYAIPLRRFKMVDAVHPYRGQWAFPDNDELVEAMRWCYNQRAEADANAQAAARWIGAHGTWDKAIVPFIELLENESD